MPLPVAAPGSPSILQKDLPLGVETHTGPSFLAVLVCALRLAKYANGKGPMMCMLAVSRVPIADSYHRSLRSRDLHLNNSSLDTQAAINWVNWYGEDRMRREGKQLP